MNDNFLRSNALANRYRAPVLVDRDVDDFGLGDSRELARMLSPIRFDQHFDSDRSSADAYKLCIETYDVAHENRRDEYDFVHSFGHDLSQCVFACLDGGSDIDVAQDDPPKIVPCAFVSFGMSTTRIAGSAK